MVMDVVRFTLWAAPPTETTGLAQERGRTLVGNVGLWGRNPLIRPRST